MYFFNTFHLPYICSGISDVVTTVNYYTADTAQSGDSNIAWIAGIGVSLGVNVAVVIGLLAICLW